MMRFIVMAVILGPLASGLRAQDVTFNAERHLPGFLELSFSEYADLYPVAEFTELEGKSISERELRATQARWRKLCEAAQRRIQAIESDPVERHLYDLERTLRHHPFYGELELRTIRDHAPVILIVEMPRLVGKVDKDKAADVVVHKKLAPALEIAALQFEERYGTPLGLERQAGFGAEVLLVLSSYRKFVKAWEASEFPTLYTAGLFLDRGTSMAVTFIETARPRALAWFQGSSIYGLSQVMVQAHLPKGSRWIGPNFWREAMAVRLTSFEREDLDTLHVIDMDLEQVRVQGARIRDDEYRRAYFLTLGEMLQLSGPHSLVDFLAPRIAAKPTREGNDWQAKALGDYQRQAGLYATFFEHHDDGKYEEAWFDYLTVAFEGGGGRADFEAAFGPGSVERLHGEWLDFIAKHCQSNGQTIEPELIRQLGSLRGRTFDGVDVDPVGVVATDPSPAEFASTRHRLLEFEEQAGADLRRAWVLAGQGRLIEARNLCKVASGTARRDEPRERARVEAVRLEALLSARTSFAQKARDQKTRLRFRLDGKLRSSRIVDVAQEHFVVEAGRDQYTLPWEALSPRLLGQHLGSMSTIPKWVQGYAALLGGSAKADEILATDASDDGQAALADLEWYATLAEDADDFKTLIGYASDPLPWSVTECESLLDSVRDTLRAHRRSRWLEEKQADLYGFATEVLGRSFQLDVARALDLKGLVTVVPPNRVRVEYDFESADQLDDFTPGRRLDDWLWLPEVRATEGTSTVTVTDDVLRLQGIACLYHKLAFKAPITVQFDLSYGHGMSAPLPVCYFNVGICSDRTGNFHFNDLGQIVISDRDREVVKTETMANVYKVGHTYECVLEHDGENVNVTLDGEVSDSLSCAGKTRGQWFVRIYSDLVTDVERLVIEGTLDLDTMAPLQRQWVDEQMVAFRRSVD